MAYSIGFFGELVYWHGVESESSSCLDDVYRCIMVAPACSTVLFSAYHHRRVYVSVDGVVSVIYRYDGVAFEDAFAFEYFQDFVICPCEGYLHMVSALGFDCF